MRNDGSLTGVLIAFPFVEGVLEKGEHSRN